MRIFFCDYFGFETESGKYLKHSRNGLQTTFEEFLEFFYRTPGHHPSARLAGFPATAALAGHVAIAPRKSPNTHIRAPFSQ
ncbi:hypothetical protein [Paraburkholderia hiiakae]|uniref:hypothetical protein n=1 Tax=Paraburkholderia hiiakae TaxID=1081782 RepID=UPI0019187087|nr:hypothetical protein [Paraburkholderia hiiakae]